jgi:hypothetical protein
VLEKLPKTVDLFRDLSRAKSEWSLSRFCIKLALMKFRALLFLSAFFMVVAPFLGTSASTETGSQVFQCGCLAYGPQGEKSFESELSTWQEGSLSFMCALAGRRFIDSNGYNHTDHYEKKCTQVDPSEPIYQCSGIAKCGRGGVYDEFGFGRATALSFFKDDPHQAAYRRAYENCSAGRRLDDYNEWCKRVQ